MLIRQSRFTLILTTWLLIALSAPAAGHELVRGVGTQTTFTFHRDHMAIELNFGVSAAEAFTMLADIDKDASDKVSTEEANRFLAARGQLLIKELSLQVNGRTIPMEIEGWEEAGLTGTVMVKPFDAYFTIRASLPPALPTGGWWLHYRDGTYRQQTSSQFCWLPMLGHGSGISFRIFEPFQFLDEGTFFKTAGRGLIVFFEEGIPSFDPATTSPPSVEELAAIALGDGDQESTPNTGDAPAIQPIPRPESFGSPGSEEEGSGESEEETIGELIRNLASGEVKLWELLVALAMAVTYGAGHALGPGHGKTMVAAYLVGSRGRVRDAVILGGVVTFAHTFSIFLLGLLLLSLIEASAGSASSATYQNWLTTIFSLLSGLLLVGFGLVLARRRWRRAKEASVHVHHDHSHGDGDDHHHHHHGEGGHSHVPQGWADGDRPTWRDLVTLGVSGGIVPCPAGFTIILVAAHFQALALGLFILLFFSLGLGLVLIAIGITLVLGKEGILNRLGERGGSTIRLLPVLSALLVSAVGGYFVFDSISRGQDSIAQMLRALADRISG